LKNRQALLASRHAMLWQSSELKEKRAKNV